MGRAKEIQIRVIPSKIANPFIRAHHYSGKVVNNSCLHFGAFLDGRLHGVLSYGPSLDKKKIIGLVEGTTWDGFLELNRMAFDDYLPRNSESYCIAKTIRLIRKQAPQVKWIISFADGCSCGDGTIYRACNFVLTDIKRNDALCLLPNGDKIHKMTLHSNPTSPPPGAWRPYLLRGDRRQVRLGRLRQRGWRHHPARLPAALYLFHRPRIQEAA